MAFFLFPQLCSFSQGIKIQVTAELTFLAMEKWVSMGKRGRDGPIVDVDPAWGVQGRKQCGAGGSGTGPRVHSQDPQRISDLLFSSCREKHTHTLKYTMQRLSGSQAHITTHTVCFE